MSINGGGNLYPNWLGSASLTVPSDLINTTVYVAGSNYATTVNVVPLTILSGASNQTLNTDNPNEIISYTLPASGLYKTDYQGVGSHASGSNWNSMSQLRWYVKVDNTVNSNTICTIEPQYWAGASVSQFINTFGSGVFSANAGQTLEWTVDADAVSGSITTGFSGGFGWITLQKIG
jgi:hypothetical protein